MAIISTNPRRPGQGHPRALVPGERWPLRLWAHLRAHRLDRELAGGTPPWESDLHRIRSLQITSRPARERLAHLLEGLITRAELQTRGVPQLSTVVLVDAPAVLEAEPELLILTARLRGAEPVATATVATLRELLSDGGGPFYLRPTAHSLADRLRELTDNLDVIE